MSVNILPSCPSCDSSQIVKNGAAHTRSRRQHFVQHALVGWVLRTRAARKRSFRFTMANKNGKQNYKCLNCGRQFVQNPQNKIINQETKDLIDKLLLEKIPLAGIVITKVSERSARGAERRGRTKKRRHAVPSGQKARQGWVGAFAPPFAEKKQEKQIILRDSIALYVKEFLD